MMSQISSGMNRQEAWESVYKGFEMFVNKHLDIYLSSMLSKMGVKDKKYPRVGIKQLVWLMERDGPTGKASLAYCFVVEYVLLELGEIRPDKNSICAEIVKEFCRIHSLTEGFRITVTNKKGITTQWPIDALGEHLIREWRNKMRRKVRDKVAIRPTVSVPNGGGTKGRKNKCTFYYKENNIHKTTVSYI